MCLSFTSKDSNRQDALVFCQYGFVSFCTNPLQQLRGVRSAAIVRSFSSCFDVQRTIFFSFRQISGRVKFQLRLNFPYHVWTWSNIWPIAQRSRPKLQRNTTTASDICTHLLRRMKTVFMICSQFATTLDRTWQVGITWLFVRTQLTARGIVLTMRMYVK